MKELNDALAMTRYIEEFGWNHVTDVLVPWARAFFICPKTGVYR
ncbi:hypothetical protein [Alicyclobacillus dauci]|uniref:Uncharacterized protein n=1 Tax=Alicyclobacillus dauci TaxID=1475485 RepID=A0ABY6Z628_9BACL|nr:hypothetical protein [Alicyclobacillus dauci]WAH38337.1 hypothetical protein NZD86_07620 [Alicyclobacillus dauci]